jgi:hypothetical protein
MTKKQQSKYLRILLKDKRPYALKRSLIPRIPYIDALVKKVGNPKQIELPHLAYESFDAVVQQVKERLSDEVIYILPETIEVANTAVYLDLKPMYVNKTLGVQDTDKSEPYTTESIDDRGKFSVKTVVLHHNELFKKTLELDQESVDRVFKAQSVMMANTVSEKAVKAMESLVTEQEQTEEWEDILYEATRRDDVQTVKEIMAQNNVDAREYRVNKVLNQYLIHAAAYYNAVEVIDYLVNDVAADINQRGLDDKTPLHYAASNASYQAVSMLLLYDADRTLTRGGGNTPLDDVLAIRENLSNVDAQLINKSIIDAIARTITILEYKS